MDELYFWAQALDNQSADFFQEKSALLEVSNEKARQQIVSKISAITSVGKKTINQDITLCTKGNLFVLELISKEMDVLNRQAFIICYGKYTDDSSVSRVQEGLTQFCQKIGRSTKVQDKEIQAIFKQAFKKTTQWIIILITIIIVIGIVKILLYKTQEENTIIKTPTKQTQTKKKIK